MEHNIPNNIMRLNQCEEERINIFKKKDKANNNLNLHLQELKKNTPSEQNEGLIINIAAKISEKQTRGITEKMSKITSVFKGINW